MPELSPATRSVFESFNSKFDWVEDGVPGPQFKAIAAALRAAADQVVPEEAPEPTGMRPCGDTFSARWIMHAERVKMRKQLLAIANELEAQ